MRHSVTRSARVLALIVGLLLSISETAFAQSPTEAAAPYFPPAEGS